MDFLRSMPRFSFKYGDKVAFEHKHTVSCEQNGNELTTVYLFEDGLKVTNVAKAYPKFDAYEWVNYIENTGKENSLVISELWDCDCTLACEYQKKPSPTALYPDKNKDMIIVHPQGSNVDEFDFYAHIDESSASKKMFLFEGGSKEYKNIGGRSSEGLAPFFNIHQNGKGWIVAIGWSGQWNFKVSREADTVRLQSKIEDTHFVLYPGEKIRTSSAVIMNYTSNLEDSQNKWRRLMLDKFSPPLNSPSPMPLSIQNWGGVESAELIKRVELLDRVGVPYDYFWVDAGWYGNATTFGINAFDGDWGNHVGEWFVCEKIHPNGMRDLAEKIKACGKKFLLWFEPERAIDTSLIGKEHPEWLLETLERPRHSRLVNFGDPDAWQYIFDMLCDVIGKLDIKCYRQDTNILPLLHWRKYDTEDRVGMTEIKHIMGLYRLWDSLLEKFPGLIIDNCASGGTRIDVENMRRSFCLWRSDDQCFINLNPEVTQAQTVNYALWAPLTSTSPGKPYYDYSVRSAYSAGIAFDYDEDIDDNEEKAIALKKYCEEFIRFSEYFLGDVYPLTKPIKDATSWSAVQWDRPERGDGMLQVFKREESPYTEASFRLRKIDVTKNYLFENVDGGKTEISGKELAEKGFAVNIDRPCSALIFIYKVID